MSEPADVRALLHRVADEAGDWFDALPERPVGPERAQPDLTIAATLPEHPTAAGDVIADLVAEASPGLPAMGSPRYFGFVVGGALPAGVAADWLSAHGTRTPASRRPRPRPPSSRRSPAVDPRRCSACPPTPRSASSPAARWRTSPRWPRPATACSPMPGGTSSATACGRAADPRRRRRRAPRHRSTARCACSGSARSARCAVAADEQGRDARRRARAALEDARRADDRLRAGRQREHRRDRSAGRDRGGRARAPARGCTSTARSDSGRRAQPERSAISSTASSSPTRGPPTRTSG